MSTSFLHDKKIMIIICSIIILIAIGGVAVTIILNNNQKPVESVIDRSRREEKTAREQTILNKLNDSSSLSDSERASLIRQLRDVQSER